MELNPLFDTHAHLLDKRLRKIEDPCREVDRILNVFEPGEGIEEYADLLKNYKICGAAGVHPHSAKNYAAMEKELEAALDLPGTVALGETGLDFHYMNSPSDIQKEVFKKQLELAGKRNLPVIVHSREAFKETLEILDSSGLSSVLIHCFTGSAEEMKQYIERGFHIAVGGVVTFPSAAGLAAAVKEAPIEKILLETDCPYMSPVPVRGKTNIPGNIRYIAARVAEIKGMPSDEVARRTYENSLKFFRVEEND